MAHARRELRELCQIMDPLPLGCVGDMIITSLLGRNARVCVTRSKGTKCGSRIFIRDGMRDVPIVK